MKACTWDLLPIVKARTATLPKEVAPGISKPLARQAWRSASYSKIIVSLPILPISGSGP